MVYIVIMTLIILFVIYDVGNGLIEFVGCLLVSAFFGGLIGGLIWILLGGLIGSYLPQEEVVTESTNIYALSDNSSISGVGFLLAGTIDEALVYRYVVDEPGKGKKVKEVNASACYVNESNDAEPRIEKIEPKFTHSIFLLFANPWDSNYYKIFLPKDSIVTDYEIDLK